MCWYINLTYTSSPIAPSSSTSTSLYYSFISELLEASFISELTHILIIWDTFPFPFKSVLFDVFNEETENTSIVCDWPSPGSKLHPRILYRQLNIGTYHPSQLYYCTTTVLLLYYTCTTTSHSYHYCTTLVLLRLEIASFVGIVVVSCELCVSLGHTLKDLLNHVVLVDTILSTSIR